MHNLLSCLIQNPFERREIPGIPLLLAPNGIDIDTNSSINDQYVQMPVPMHRTETSKARRIRLIAITIAIIITGSLSLYGAYGIFNTDELASTTEFVSAALGHELESIRDMYSTVMIPSVRSSLDHPLQGKSGHGISKGGCDSDNCEPTGDESEVTQNDDATSSSLLAPQNLIAVFDRPKKYTSYFSNYTLTNEDGRNRRRKDDLMCNHVSFSPENCSPAPYLYVTYHGGRNHRRVKNICKYSRNGCSLGSVLMPNSQYVPRSLRGMLHHRGSLFVAEAWRKGSKLLRFSRCNPTLGNRRELLQILVETNDTMDEGMIHPYGFAKRPEDPYIYVSAQGTYSVLRFNLSNGNPGPIPLSLMRQPTSPEIGRNKSNPLQETKGDSKGRVKGQQLLHENPLRDHGYKLNRIYNGTFVALGNDEVRGIAFDSEGFLYVANKQKGVMVFDENGFSVKPSPFNVPNPISVYYCDDRDSIWIGSAKHHALYEFDATKWTFKQRIRDDLLKHPAGLVSHGDALYVVSQEKNKLLQFSMRTRKLQSVVLPTLPDVGERVSLSNC